MAAGGGTARARRRRRQTQIHQEPSPSSATAQPDAGVPVDEALWQLVRRPALDANRKIEVFRKTGALDSEESSLRSLTQTNGLKYLFADPRFAQRGPVYDYGELDGLDDLVLGVLSRPVVARKFALPGTRIADRKDLMPHELAMVPLVLAERYIAARDGGQAAQEDLLRSLYRDQEQYLFDRDPRADIVIPLLGVQFGEEYQFNDFSIVAITSLELRHYAARS
jgi:hypothetical protein